MNHEMTDNNAPLRSTARRTLVVVVIVALALLAWQIVDALLLVFMGLLLAVLFRGLGRKLAAHTPLSMGWALGVVALLVVGGLVLGGYLLGPRISAQFSELSETLPQSVQQLRESLQGTPLGDAVLDQVQNGSGGMPVGGDIFSRLSGVASGLMSFITNLVLVLFAGIFFSINPGLYRDGTVLLVPRGKTERLRETLDVCGRALWSWTLGRLTAMVFVGVATVIGLWIVGVPLALVLGLIAGLLDFVPFIGPIAASVPGILLGFTVGPMEGVYAALVYLVVQQLEGNVVTPLVQQEQVSLPPVLVLFAVVAAGLVFGVLGILVATPLVVVIMVMTKMLYVEDVLGKETEVPGRD